MKNKFKFIDLFAGIGGFRLVLEEFGGNCVYSSEWDKQAQITYNANFAEIPDGDITKVNEKEIPKHDILCAGFPCQAFSISGKQKGFEDVRGTLFFEIARIAKFHQPKILFLENVKNFASHDDGKTLRTVVEVLDNIGYNIFYKVLNASNYGAVTSRQRIYIVAFRKDLNIRNFSFPEASNSKDIVADILEETVDESLYINRKDIFVNLENDAQNSLFSVSKPIRIGQISKGGQGERIYSIYGHAITLSAYGGGVASKTGAYLINGRVRKLSIRECARVMGFPETFKIPVSNQQAYKQFGNSVAIPVVRAVFKKIISIDNIWHQNTDTQQNLDQVSQKEALIMNRML